MGASNSNAKPKGEPRVAKLSPDEAPPMARLSHDIMRDILLRVPPSFHRTAAAVCLMWRGIIRDPCFAAALEGKYRPKIVITRNIGYCSTFVGVCNGLLCVQDMDDRVLMLVDPIKKEAVPLPQPKGPSYFYLGFDRETLKFKLLALTEYYSSPVNYFAQVLDQGKASWRKTRSALPLEPYRKDATTVRGVCYWLGNNDVSGIREDQLIISFDFTREEFSVISTPEPATGRCLFLTDMMGRLGLMDRKREEFKIWSQKDGEENWVLEHRFFFGGLQGYTMSTVNVVGSRRDGKVVLLAISTDDGHRTYRRDLITLDASNDTMKRNMWVDTQEAKNCGGMAGYFITESPFSIHSLWRPNLLFPAGAEKVFRLMGKKRSDRPSSMMRGEAITTLGHSLLRAAIFVSFLLAPPFLILLNLRREGSN